MPHTAPGPRRLRAAPPGLRGRTGGGATLASPPRGARRGQAAATLRAAAATGPGRPVGAAPHPRRCLRTPGTLASPPPPAPGPASSPAPAPAPPRPSPRSGFGGPVRGAGQAPGWGDTHTTHPSRLPRRPPRGGMGPAGPRRPLGLAGAALPPPQSQVKSRSQT